MIRVVKHSLLLQYYTCIEFGRFILLSLRYFGSIFGMKANFVLQSLTRKKLLTLEEIVVLFLVT